MNLQFFKKLENNIKEVDFIKKNKRMLILLLSNNKFLEGVFEGFCHISGCRIKLFELSSYDNFFKALKKESPSGVVIDMSHAARLMNSPGWEEIRLLLMKSNITIYGFKELASSGSQAESNILYYKDLTQPLSFPEMMSSLRRKMVVANENRFGERRQARDRRKLEMEQEAASNSAGSFLDNASNVFNVSDDVAVPFGDSALSLNVSDTSHIQPALKQNLSVGPLLINYEGKSIFFNDIPVKMSPKEFQIIELLAEQQGKVVKIEDIIRKIWGGGKNATKADVHQYMYMLRKKLRKDVDSPSLIVTVKGFGYKLHP